MMNNDLGRRVWRILYPVLIYFGVYFLVSILASIVGMTVSVIEMEKSGATMDVYALVERTYQAANSYYLPMTLAVGLIVLPVMVLLRWMDRKENNSPETYEKVSAPFYLASGVLGAAACLAINGMLNLSRLTTVLSEDLEQVGTTLYSGKLIFELVVVAVLMPVTEEYIFRGVIQERIRNWTKPEIAIIASAAVFALYHGNTLQIIYTFLLGLLLGYVYEKFHHILAPIMLHVFANFVSVVVSETGAFGDLLKQENTTGLVIFTGVWCVIVVAVIYLLHEKVHPAVIRRTRTENREELLP